KGLTVVSGNNFIVHLHVPIEDLGNNFIFTGWSYLVLKQRTYGRFRKQLYCSSTKSLPSRRRKPDSRWPSSATLGSLAASLAGNPSSVSNRLAVSLLVSICRAFEVRRKSSRVRSNARL